MTSGKVCVPSDDDKQLTREEARAAGYTQFWPTKPCRRGHLAWRGVANNTCSACLAEKREGVEQVDIHPRMKALEAGEKRYWNDTPCVNGHVGWRQTANHTCLECMAEKNRRVALTPNRDLDHVLSRQDALAAGLMYYRTGEPCPYGHTGLRSVKRGDCIDCKDGLKKQGWPDYYARNKQRISEKSRQDREANPEKHRAWERAWGRRNKPTKAKSERHRRALKRGAEGRHTLADIADILRMQRGRCAECRKKVGAHYHVDHIMPLSKGGSNGRRNLQVLCESCNCRKHASDPLDWARTNGRLL